MEKQEKDVLEELREFYNKGLVSALIGSGFSKNVSDSYPGWSELLFDMVADLYAVEFKNYYANYVHINGNEEESIVKKKYIDDILEKENCLTLVSKYINKKGCRDYVETYIEERIPYVERNKDRIVLKIGDKEVENVIESKFSAHKALLLCNLLKNIYTTNYENLLEFTTDLMRDDLQGPIEVILCRQDLSDKDQCRKIVKIHGNLRKDSTIKMSFDGDNKLCYIIAEEDYRTYPDKHDTFTSMMQMTMLQGRFLLIGFSGDDDNYKGWVEWMRDVLEGEDEDLTKIYIVTFDKRPIPIALQSYYHNHRIKVLNLLEKDKLQAIGCSEDFIESILSKRLNNDDKRDILTYFLKFLASGIKNINEQSPQLEEKLKSLKPTYSYRKLWNEACEKVYGKESIDKILMEIMGLRPTNKFPKIIYNQEHIIDVIIYKSKLSKEEAQLLALAVDECGLNPHYYSQVIQDSRSLDKLPLWNLLKAKEDTFNGVSTKLLRKGDSCFYENIQRSLFHLDFKKANRLIKQWKPSGHFIFVKAMRLAALKGQQEIAFNTLVDYIRDEDSPLFKLYAMQIANYISNIYPWPYNTDELFQDGIEGIGDNLQFMVQQLRGKLEAPKIRGWIGSTMNFGVSHQGYEKSLRILRYISDTGLYLNFGHSCFFEQASWYLVFHNLYEEFPYPCFFYSIQYHDSNLLTRIGQDFAYSPKLSGFNKDILLKAIRAIGDENTPPMFIEGLLRIIGPIYFAVDENEWFDLFEADIFNQVISDFGKYDLSAPVIKNIEYALNGIENPNNIYHILSVLLNLYSENIRLSDYLIRHNLHIEYLKGTKKDDIWGSIQKLIEGYPQTDTTELVYYLDSTAILPDNIKSLFLDIIRKADIDTLPQSLSSSLHLCLIAKDDPEVLKKVKRIFLKQNIWHCGIIEDGRGWSTPNYIRLSALKDKITWTDEDFFYIRDNLIENIAKYDEFHARLHEEAFLRNEQIGYLSDVLRFIDGLCGERKATLTDVRNRVESLLNERLNYKTLIEGMLSVQSMDVSFAIDNVVQGIVAKDLETYQNEFSFILDQAIVGEGLAINKMLDAIRWCINNNPKEIVSLGFSPKLYTLLSIYKDRWQQLREFKPVWSFNYLYEIAEFLKGQNYVEDEVIKYWLTDPFVQRFIRQ